MQPGCLAVKTPNITSLSDLATYPVEGKETWYVHVLYVMIC